MREPIDAKVRKQLAASAELYLKLMVQCRSERPCPYCERLAAEIRHVLAALLAVPVPHQEEEKNDEDLHARIGRSSQSDLGDHAPTGDASSHVGSRNDGSEMWLMWLRREWWMNHGCPFHMLYGDDGEMQCNADTCRKDFRRDPLQALQRHVEVRRMVRVSTAFASGPAATPGHSTAADAGSPAPDQQAGPIRAKGFSSSSESSYPDRVPTGKDR